MIEVRLYSGLRGYAPRQDPRSDSVVRLLRRRGDTLERLLSRLGIAPREVGLVVLDGVFVPFDELRRPVKDESRVALFPADHAALFTCGILRP